MQYDLIGAMLLLEVFLVLFKEHWPQTYWGHNCCAHVYLHDQFLLLTWTEAVPVFGIINKRYLVSKTGALPVFTQHFRTICINSKNNPKWGIGQKQLPRLLQLFFILRKSPFKTFGHFSVCCLPWRWTSFKSADQKRTPLTSIVAPSYRINADGLSKASNSFRWLSAPWITELSP